MVWEKLLQRAALVAATVVGVASLSACAVVAMQDKPSIKTAPPDMALVNFVRPAVFGGDAVSVDLWDGDHLIGALSAGTMVQYQIPAGTHLFLGKANNWSYIKADLAAGKQYFIKANIFPGIPIAGVALGVAKKDDKRIPTWLNEYHSVAFASEDERKAAQAARLADVQKALANFRDGGVTRYLKITPEEGL